MQEKNMKILQTDYSTYAIMYNCQEGYYPKEQVVILTRENFPERVETELQKTIEAEFLKLFGPDATDADHEPLVFSEDVTKANQNDKCEIMEEINYQEYIPKDWTKTMFSKSRIAVLAPEKRAGAH